MKKIILLLTTLLFAFYSKAATQKITVLFEKDKSTLTEASKEQLNHVLPAQMFYLMGHTDNDGDDNYNQSLSKRRVDAVATYLRSKKRIDRTKLITNYFGERQPVNPNLTEEQKSQNRRVVVSYIADPLLVYDVPVQLFTINNYRDTTVVGENGTKLFFPAHCFKEQNVSIQLREYTDTKSILSANLSTLSDGRMLETSGMVYVEAYDNDYNRLELQQPMDITFKNKGTTYNDFKYFKGEYNQDLSMNWTTSGTTKQNYDEGYLRQFQIDANGYNGTHLVGSLLSSLKKITDDKSFIALANVPCFQDSKVYLDIDLDGKLRRVVTNLKDKSCECEQLFQSKVKQYFDHTYAIQKNASYNYEDQPHIEFGVRNVSTDKRAKGQLEPLAKTIVKFDDFAMVIKGKQLEKLAEAKQKADSIEYAKREEETNAYFEQLAFAQRKLSEEQIKNYKAFKEIEIATANMGWINCDRFLSSIMIPVSIKTNDEVNFRLVFKKINAILAGSSINNQSDFSVPANEDVTMIATQTKDNKYYYDIQKVNTSQLSNVKLNLKEVDHKKLSEEVSKI
ncbi:MAG: OmpA family protein [Chitinophagales bacterium]